jgi:hypothetical protein
LGLAIPEISLKSVDYSILLSLKNHSIMKTLSAFVALISLIVLLSQASADTGFTIEEVPSGLIIKHNGELVTNYVIDQANKPYMWPLIGPNRKPMTRAYPMQDIEGERQDHPHHRSIWFGHQNMGGFDTWTESMTYTEREEWTKERIDEALAKIGRTVHREFSQLDANEKRAIVKTKNDYVGSAGEKLLSDERTIIFRKTNSQLIIDFDISLIASYGDIELGDIKDAGLCVRIPTALDLKTGKGGTIINSEGIRDGDTWSKRATWVDYNGLMDGERVGIAILNHPSSFNHPTPWHVRDYGLFTANPFGFKSLDESREDITFTLAKGTRVLMKHRIIFHKGDEKKAKIAQAFERYAKQ